MATQTAVELHSPSVGQMLSWIRRIVGFGVRRPGYAQSLAVERWLEATFRELGLDEVRGEPVNLNYWEPTLTSLALGADGAEFPCSPLPYTAWTAPGGAETESVFLGDGTAADFDRVDVRGKIVVIDARFAVLTGAPIKQQALFVRDANHSISDGPIPFARWLIHNFPAYYEAASRGAAGFVGLLGDLPVNGSEYYVPYDGFLKKLPGVWAGREHSNEVRELAKAGGAARLISSGENRLVDTHNIVAVVPGSGRKHAADSENENIIVTCHHDAPYASAVEDASGLAALLALAKHFSALRAAGEGLSRDLVFVASSGHFHGGIGNRVFVEHHKEGLLKHSVAAFGVEHIGEDVEADEQGRYRLTGQPATRALFFDGSQKLLGLVAEEAERAKLDRVLCLNAYFIGPEPPCDSAPFFTAGIPSTCHLSAPFYLFDPHDTIDKVCVPELPRVVGFFSSLIRRVDTQSAEELSVGMRRPRGLPEPEMPAWFRPPQ